MGVFSKLKGIFYDEVEVDDKEEEKIEPKKSNKKEEPVFEKPKVEKIDFSDLEDNTSKDDEDSEKSENTFSERELFRNERTFNFTEFDDDEDDLPPRKNILDIEKQNSRLNSATTEPEQPKVFKPSPIISPIYGILDKDYKKDDIIEKPLEPEENQITSKATTYDTVRRKAYGTLEDDLEDTLNSLNKISTTDINEKSREYDNEKSNDKKAKIEDLINKLEDATDEFDKTTPIGELEDKVKLENFDDDDDKEDTEDKTMTDSSLEHDLFNLIDSMYDDKEE